MTNGNEIGLFPIEALLLLVPGWAFLAITGLWRYWRPLHRWIVATGLGIAFYPIVYYWARLVLPGYPLGFNKLLFLLAGLILLTGWRLRKSWKEQLNFARLEWIAIGFFLLIIFTRLWVAYFRPFPAWTDSLHHSLLTQLTAANGQLPFTLEPYEPVALNMYHLGLYAITGSMQILSQAPAHSSLLWTVQVLNGLCGLGVYLVLDSRVGRKAALAGAAVAGLFSIQPAWYVNWGRDTQLASQAILLISWWVTWEALRAWIEPRSLTRSQIVALTLASACLSAGVFLIHFRVAGFYLPLIAISAGWEIIRAIRGKVWKRAFVGVAVTGAISLLLTIPSLVTALEAYFDRSLQSGLTADLTSSEFFNSSFEAFLQFGIPPWLLVITGLASLFLLIRRSRFGILVLAWVLLLWLEGNAYRLNIPLLAFTNPGAVIIMVYLPVSLLVGAAVEEVFCFFPVIKSQKFQLAGLILLILAGLAGAQARMTEVEEFRYFMTPADEEAMGWIRENIPADATFAINTYMWLNSSPHGTDGGYWIPYFTGRKTSTGSMLNSFGSKDYFARIQALSRLVLSTETQPRSATDLCAAGISYVYIGAKGGNVFGPGLSTGMFMGVRVVYDHNSIKILKICP